ncbi:apolipoprotein C-II [Brienomyrus brachyistius]|uniref:apolipoprotein C-II n=1 Tax=Brienomyrus brachyistius TaxID=42636 RepID=UPI0020B3DB57|nr:apolipoprotein C-II [Brienomyrus brachyistius]XP_048880349.1 apolipoprotein C-II [Brienomyrus brachyistius]
MNKLLAIAVLVAVISYDAECLRIIREVTEETEATVADTLWSYWDNTFQTANGWMEQVKGWKLDEKAKDMYDDTTKAVTTYGAILQDQVYHLFYTH